MNQLTFEEIHENLKYWASKRHLLDKDPHVQLTKTAEEFGETCAGYNKHHEAKLQDSIGDLLVTICIFCHQTHEDPIACFNEAWQTIKDRHGKTINGIFVKDSDLK